MLIRWIVVIGLLLGFVFGIFWVASSLLSFIQQRFEDTAPTPGPSITQSQDETKKPDTNLVRCKDEDIAVTVSIDESTPAISEQDIVIENADEAKIWSTDTCPAHNKSNLVEPQFGDVYQMVVTWPGTEDAVECGKRGRGVTEGEYLILSRNGDSTSDAIKVQVTE